MKKKYTFIDLFAGCGGLSEGFLQTGCYEGLAHVEWEMPMVNTLRNRLEKKWEHSKQEAKDRVVCFDVQKTDELIHGNWSEETIAQYGSKNSEFVMQKGLEGLVGRKLVDLIIGGPPCQAYSLAGRAQDPNSMKNDYRNYLFESFVKIVDHFQPKERIFEAFESIGYEIRTPEKLNDSVYCAVDFNTPQQRNRIIIIGVKKGGELLLEDIYNSLDAHKGKGPRKTVRDAIGHMPKFRPLEIPRKEGKQNISHELAEPCDVTQHYARYHNPRDIQVFRDWLSKGMNSYSQQAKLDYYTSVSGKKSNHIKYRSLEWDKPSPTIVAHLHKDGLMFIHPDVN